MAVLLGLERKLTAMMRRVEAVKARVDRRAWVVARRERTHHLIELGGLVHKAGLVELTNDDRAVLLGAFITLTEMLGGENRSTLLEYWRRRGRRAFDADERASSGVQSGPDE